MPGLPELLFQLLRLRTVLRCPCALLLQLRTQPLQISKRLLTTA